MVSIEEWCAAAVSPKCDICRITLHEGVTAQRDCGGTCLRCMADCGDQDCQKVLGEFRPYTDEEPLSMENFPW